MGFIINPFMVAAAAAATTTKITVKEILFDEENDCACSLDSSTQVWEDDINEGGGDLSPSIGDVVGDGSSVCAEVTALNATGSVDSYTYESFADCAECNSSYAVCEDMGEGPGGP